MSSYDAFGIERYDLVVKAHIPEYAYPGLMIGGGAATAVAMNEVMRRKRNRKTGKNVTRKEQYRNMNEHPSRRWNENTAGRKAWTEPVAKAKYPMPPTGSGDLYLSQHPLSGPPQRGPSARMNLGSGFTTGTRPVGAAANEGTLSAMTRVLRSDNLGLRSRARNLLHEGPTRVGTPRDAEGDLDTSYRRGRPADQPLMRARTRLVAGRESSMPKQVRLGRYGRIATAADRAASAARLRG